MQFNLQLQANIEDAEQMQCSASWPETETKAALPMAEALCEV